jgi:lipid II:glycine glycyltransferase (peptidoglycan interpeptide bridge formation enzyme)
MLFDFQKATLEEKRVRHAYTEEHMQQLMNACVEHDSGTLYLAYEDGQLQAAIWNVWDASRSYYLMGGKNPDSENYRAMSALLWHCIREARHRGNRFFDFEGSMDGGVERFFRSFGARRELYLVLRRDGHWLWKLLGALRMR